jgi:hypothetical protein
MAYEVEAIDTGRRMGLHVRDWKALLDLARRYGWRPGAGLGHHLHESPQTVSSYDAQFIAEALGRALEDLPAERRKELRPTDTTDAFLFADKVRHEPHPDPKGYFSWERRWIVAAFVALCQQGDLEIRRM